MVRKQTQLKAHIKKHGQLLQFWSGGTRGSVFSSTWRRERFLRLIGCFFSWDEMSDEEREAEIKSTKHGSDVAARWLMYQFRKVL